MTLNLTTFPARPQLVDDLVQRFLAWNLRHVLPIVAGLNGPTQSQLAALDRMLTHQRSQERRLATAVRSDESDDVTALNRCREIGDQRSAIDAKPQIARNSNLISASLGEIENQA